MREQVEKVQRELGSVGKRVRYQMSLAKEMAGRQGELMGSVAELAREVRRSNGLVARLGEQTEEGRGLCTVVTRRPPRLLLPSSRKMQSCNPRLQAVCLPAGSF